MARREGPHRATPQELYEQGRRRSEVSPQPPAPVSSAVPARKVAAPPSTRPLTLPQARALFQQRYTLDHVPRWATFPLRRDRLGQPEDYPAPQYASDQEWYERTTFPGENGLSAQSKWCIAARPTWPLGRERLTRPYSLQDSHLYVCDSCHLPRPACACADCPREGLHRR